MLWASGDIITNCCGFWILNLIFIFWVIFIWLLKNMLSHLDEVYVAVTNESKQMTLPSLKWQLREVRDTKGGIKASRFILRKLASWVLVQRSQCKWLLYSEIAYLAPCKVNWPLAAITLYKIFICIQILEIIYKIIFHCVKLGKLFSVFLVQSAQQQVKYSVVATAKWSLLKYFRSFIFTVFLSSCFLATCRVDLFLLKILMGVSENQWHIWFFHIYVN